MSPPAGARSDARQRHRAREPADRDRQPVVRRGGDARAARRLAGPQLPMGLRSPRASSAATSSHLSLISSGAETIVAQSNDELAATALSGSARSAAGRAHRRRCARASRCARSARRSRSRPMRRRGPARGRRSTDSCSPATGSRRACPRRSSRPSSPVTAAAQVAQTARPSASPIDLRPRHYSEIALKGKNRSWFVGRLVRNLHSALAGLHVKEVRTPIGRIEIVLGQDDALPEVRDRLSRVFGVAQLLGGDPRAARLRRHGRRDRVAAAAAAKRPSQFPRARAPRRLRSSRCRHRISRAISDRACGPRAAGRSISITPTW